MTSYHRTKYQFHRGASELSAISSCSGSHDPAPSAPALETQDTWGSGCPCALLCTETSVPRTPAHHTASPLHSNLPYCPSKPLSLAMVTFTLPLYFGTSLVAQMVKNLPANAGVKSLSRVQLFATPWTVVYQAPLSMGYSRQECWSGLPFPSPMHESESEVAQLCPTLRDTMDCSLPGSSTHGIFQARVLEWVAISFSIYIYVCVYVCVRVYVCV